MVGALITDSEEYDEYKNKVQQWLPPKFKRKNKMHTPDITERNITAIGELFPNAITETLDKDGRPKVAIDFDVLRRELAPSLIEGAVERYQLDWPGKRAALLAANAPIAKTLRPMRDESIAFNTTRNLFIEGDNLDALKLLQETYLGKIKVIYIDPPYNTGSDFVYADDFSVSASEDLVRSNQQSQAGERLVANLTSNGRFHSDWLSMMYPRIRLARNLLTEDGVIFVSIGRDELANLRSVCAEIFGANNVIATISREQKSGSNQGDFVAPQLDYVIVCARNSAELKGFVVPRKESEKESEKSLYQSSLDPLRGCVNQRYWIECPDGSFIIPPGNVFPERVEDGSHVRPATRADKVWRWSYSSYLGQKDQLRFKKTSRGSLVDQNGNPASWNVYTVKSNVDSEMRPRDYIFGLTNAVATSEMKDLQLDGVFDNPKPTELVQYLIDVVADAKDAIVLDFFGGSGTTGHSVMAMNARDGGTRQYIVVQLNEPVGADTEAHERGYSTIAGISRARLRRAGEQLLARGGDTRWNGDVGFRAFKIDSSNLVDTFYTPADTDQEQLLVSVESVKPGRSDEDLLFQVLVDWGVDLSLPIADDLVNDVPVFSVDDDTLIACFASSVDEVTVTEIAKRKPLRAVFRDSGFASDAVRINAEQAFAEFAPNSELRTI